MATPSRTSFAIKNVFYSYIGTFTTTILSFITRTIFIKLLGSNYLGVNGLFTDVLGVLSFAELGFGTAMNFSLYKPVAENDREKIKSLIYLYKKAYYAIAIIITVLGLLLLPFLHFIVKDPGNIGDIRIYFLVFLFNTVSSYFVSYKYSIINAEQKNYIYTNVNTLTIIVQNIIQIIVLLVFKNFLFYLITAAIVLILQKVIFNVYLNKKYPLLLEKNIQPLDEYDLISIKRNVKGLILHKFGDISIHQTDNIIVSSCINIATTGIISNYNLIINTLQSFLNSIFNNVTSSFGNLVATTTKEKQLDTFMKYNFLNFWLFGFCSICILTLVQPFITLWIGGNNLIDILSLFLIVINFYLAGQRVAFLNFKTAYGIFYDDKFVVLQAALINLIISILLAQLIGLPGIYIGTVVSGLYQSIRRPKIAFFRMTGVSVKYYFIVLIKYFTVVFITGFLLYSMFSFLEITWLSFLMMIIVNCIVINLIFIIIFKNTNEFKYMINLLKNLLRREV